MDCTHEVGQDELFRLWINLYHLLTEQTFDDFSILQAIIAAKDNTTFKGKHSYATIFYSPTKSLPLADLL